MKIDVWSLIAIVIGLISISLSLTKQMDITGYFGILFILIGLYRIR